VRQPSEKGVGGLGQPRAFPEARTADGRRVRLFANVGQPEELDLALAAGAEGVGVLRTEFLFLRAAPPGEDEQYETYRAMVERLAGRPLIIRTLDAGGDKPLPYLPLEPEPNPFLGLRGLRLSLARPDLFRTQLRAILRAAAYGRVSLMYPMVADASEVVRARAELDRARVELAERGVAVGDVEAGAMVEVPSAAICADLLAREVAFLSVGTNDLAQYTLAADRGNPAVADVYSQTHPAVLRLLRATVEGAQRWGRAVAVCGEVAGDVAALPLLVGLGVDELSVAPPALEPVRAALATLSYEEARALVKAGPGLG
jgi:phosphoenolpyruvate-protein phosphotransferase